MYVLDETKLRRVMEQKGYRSFSALARQLGMHRNTIQYYLAGAAIFPKNFERILTSLDIAPQDVLKKKNEPAPIFYEPIISLVDQLHHQHPFTFVLFGSRVQKTNHPYSDWDLGVYSAQGVPHQSYRDLINLKDEITTDLPFFVDLINLNNADNEFLKNISKNWMFLTGKQSDWLDLNRKVQDL